MLKDLRRHVLQRRRHQTVGPDGVWVGPLGVVHPESLHRVRCVLIPDAAGQLFRMPADHLHQDQHAVLFRIGQAGQIFQAPAVHGFLQVAAPEAAADLLLFRLIGGAKLLQLLFLLHLPQIPHQLVDPLADDVVGRGLHHVIVGPQRDGLLRVAELGVAGQEDDPGLVPLFPHPAHQIYTGLHRHFDVAEHDVRLLPPERQPGFHGVSSRLHALEPLACPINVFRKTLQGRLLVIYDQKFHSPGLSPSSAFVCPVAGGSGMMHSTRAPPRLLNRIWHSAP